MIFIPEWAKNFLAAAADGKPVQVRYDGKWVDINLEGLARRMGKDHIGENDLRMKPKKKITKEEALQAVNKLYHYNGDDGAYYLLLDYFEQ